MTRRVHLEVNFDPHGVVPPRLSYTGTNAAHFELNELGVGAGRAGVGQQLERGLHQLEAAIAARPRCLQLAVDGDALAQPELVAQIRPVEPDALDGALAKPRNAAGQLDSGRGKAQR